MTLCTWTLLTQVNSAIYQADAKTCAGSYKNSNMRGLRNRTSFEKEQLSLAEKHCLEKTDLDGLVKVLVSEKISYTIFSTCLCSVKKSAATDQSCAKKFVYWKKHGFSTSKVGKVSFFRRKLWENIMLLEKISVKWHY